MPEEAIAEATEAPPEEANAAEAQNEADLEERIESAEHSEREYSPKEEYGARGTSEDYETHEDNFGDTEKYERSGRKETKEGGSERNWASKYGKSGKESKAKAHSKISKDEKSRLEEILDKDIEEYAEEWIEKFGYWPKEIYYIIKSFLKTGSIDDENPYKVIDRKARDREPLALFLPGVCKNPYDTSEFEKYTGFPTVRIGTYDPREINKILDYAARKTGVGSILIGYSDGGIRAKEAVELTGGKNISMYYGVDANKGDVEKYMDPRRVAYINGASVEPGHLVGIFESIFYGHANAHTDRPIFKIPGASHAELAHGRNAISQIGDIIRNTARIKYNPQFSMN
ncbi:hypothetical protein J4212_07975 [Candidatus Woesearchaeota archaeon]|nr:hypothetical protein [Candidatus Woesearchaeota archaeon]